MLAANNQVPVVPSTAFTQDNEEEEVVEVGLGLQKFAEKLDFIVAGLEVVKSVEETKHKIVQTNVISMPAEHPCQFQQKILLKTAPIRFVFNRTPSPAREECFEIIEHLFHHLLD
jgi:hypothetical protein